MSDRSVGIDELLGGVAEDDEVPEVRRDGQRGRDIFKFAFAALCLSAVGFFVLSIMNLGMPFWFLYLSACAVVASYQAVRSVRPPLPGRSAWRRHSTVDAPDGLRGAVKRWETRLDWCYTDNGAYTRKVLPLLGEVVDERLRQRHGITRESDPATAYKVIGEPLWTYLAGPIRRPPSPRELANLIAWMERI
jgi:hypothetical protein